MKVIGGILILLGSLVLLGSVVALGDPHHNRLGVIGAACAAGIVLSVGVGVYYVGHQREQARRPARRGYGDVSLSWLDTQFNDTATWMLVLASILFSVPMWLAAGIGWGLGDHPRARRRACVVFVSISAFMAACGIGMLLFGDRVGDLRAGGGRLAEPTVDVDGVVPTRFVTHNATGAGLRAPPDWTATTGDDGRIELRPPGVGGGVIQLSSIALPPTQTADATYRFEVAQITGGTNPHFKPRTAELVRLAGQRAVRLVFDDLTPGRPALRCCQFARVVDGREYVFTFLAQPARFDALLPTVIQIATSWRVAGEVAAAPTVVAQRPAPPPAKAPAAPRGPDVIAAPPRATPAAPPDADLPLTAHAVPSGGGGTWSPRVRRPSARPGPSLTMPTDAAARTQLAAIEAGWSPSAARPVDLLATMTGGTRDADGLTLSPRLRATSAARFKPPVTFRIVALTAGNDTRLAYAADQIIFNWEMRPTELRVDGGPASGRHADGAGALPAGEWAGIEMTVTASELVLRVNGHETYRTAADFSRVDAPLAITAHVGTAKLRSVTVLRP